MEVSAGLPVAALCLADTEFADVTLVAFEHADADGEGGKSGQPPPPLRLPAHRVLLSRLSGYFASAFRFRGASLSSAAAAAAAAAAAGSGPPELRVDLPRGVAAGHLQTAVRYLYGASVSLSPANVVPLLVLADYLMVAPLYSSALAYAAVCVRHDAGALATVLGAAADAGVPLLEDVCTHAAATTCWGQLAAGAAAGVAAAAETHVSPPRRGAAGTLVPPPPPAPSSPPPLPRLPLWATAAAAHHQALAILRSLPPDTAALGGGSGGNPLGGGGGPLPPVQPLGAAGAAVVASAVASQVSASPAGPAAQALAAGGAAPPAAALPRHRPSSASTPGLLSAGGGVGGGDVDAASRHWMRSHLSGLLRTSALFPRRLRAAPAAPGGGGFRPGGGGDPQWLAAAGAETDRLAAWARRRLGRAASRGRGQSAAGGGVSASLPPPDADGDSSDGDDDVDPAYDGSGASAYQHLSHPSHYHPPAPAALSPAEVARLREEVSDVLWTAFLQQLAPSMGAGGGSGGGGNKDAAATTAAAATAAATADTVRSFLVELDDVLAIAAVAPVLKGDLLWALLTHAVLLLGAPAASNEAAPPAAATDARPHQEHTPLPSLALSDAQLVQPLLTAVAVAFASPHVRRGIAAALAPPRHEQRHRTGSSDVRGHGGSGAGFEPRIPPAAVVPRDALADADAADAAAGGSGGALVPAGNPPARSVPLPRVPSTGSLGSHDGGGEHQRRLPVVDDGADGNGDGDDSASEGDDGDDDAPPAAAVSRYTLPSAGHTSVAAILVLPGAPALLLAHTLSAHVLRADELRVRSEDEVVGFVMDAVLTLWLGTLPAAAAVAAARAGAAPAAAAAVDAAGLDALRQLTASLWQCVRWEHTTAAACAGSIAAVQLLCAQGGSAASVGRHGSDLDSSGAPPSPDGGASPRDGRADSYRSSSGSGAAGNRWAIDIGIDGGALRAAYDRHRLGQVVTTPAAAVACGLLPPRLSYARRPRAMLLGSGAPPAGASNVNVAVHATATDVTTASTAVNDMYAIQPWGAQGLQLALLSPAVVPAATAAAASPVDAPTPQRRLPERQQLPHQQRQPVRVVFGSHAVHLLTYGPPLPLLTDAAPAAAAAEGGVALTQQPPAAADEVPAGDGDDGGLPSTASSASASRLMRVHRRRRQQQLARRMRAGTLDGGAAAAADDGVGSYDDDDVDGGGGGRQQQVRVHRLGPSPASPWFGGSGDGTAAPDTTPLVLPLVALPLPDADGCWHELRTPAAATAAALAPLPSVPPATTSAAPVNDMVPLQPLATAPPLALTDAPPHAAPSVGEPAAPPPHPPPPPPPSLDVPWPPTADTYARLFGPPRHAGDDGNTRAPPLLLQGEAADRVRDRARQVAAAYGDVFGHLAVRRGWRALPFTPAHVDPVFTAAAQVVALVRHWVDAVWRPGFRIRRLDGNGQAFLWALPPPPPPEAEGNAPQLVAWRASAWRGLVHATLQDGAGYVDGLDDAVVDAALAGHPGP